MKQKDQVVAALERNGGYATFSELNHLLDFSNWKSKSPAATVRCIVQRHPELFYKIMPGLWGLVSMKTTIASVGVKAESSAYTHAYYQGLLVEIGNAKGFGTYVPQQDKNRPYSHKTLGDVATVGKMYDFGYDKLMRRARTVDAVWFNERKMPSMFFEVEHTTDIQNSLDKFYELQDFRSRYFIVADVSRKPKFEDLMSFSRYDAIRKLVGFYDYAKLVKWHQVVLEESACAIV